MTDQFFNEIRHLLEIRVGPVGFEHGELRIMFSGNAFVAKVAIDFKDLVEPAYQQPFQIKLRRNAQIKIETERFVVGAERLGRRASSDRLQDWRLDFQKAALFEETSRLPDDCDTFFEHGA